MIQRRKFLAKSGVMMGLGILGYPAMQVAAKPTGAQFISGASDDLRTAPPLARVIARPDRLIRISVGLRPFRAAGPRFDVERVANKIVVHNYGHGGSGWSLSWGAAEVVVKNVLSTGINRVAVIGCGAAGLTSALKLQQRGCIVTIYTRERPPEVTSSYATGVWSPDSRLSLKALETPTSYADWERLCRSSYRHFQTLLGLPGDPVRWVDRYALSDVTWDEYRERRQAEAFARGEPEFVKFSGQTKGLTPEPDDLPAGSHPFPANYVRRSANMVFNLSALSRRLMDDFLLAGGKIENREFTSPNDFSSLTQEVIVNATGLGSQQLFSDSSLTPVRGQLALLIPQPEVNYSLSGEGFSMVPRSDGIVVQSQGASDFGNNDLTVDPSETNAAISELNKVIALI